MRMPVMDAVVSILESEGVEYARPMSTAIALKPVRIRGKQDYNRAMSIPDRF
jgi:hypothetical protein